MQYYFSDTQRTDRYGNKVIPFTVDSYQYKLVLINQSKLPVVNYSNNGEYYKIWVGETFLKLTKTVTKGITLYSFSQGPVDISITYKQGCMTKVSHHFRSLFSYLTDKEFSLIFKSEDFEFLVAVYASEYKKEESYVRERTIKVREP